MIEQDLEVEAGRILSAAKSSRTTLNLIGALAIRFHCETAKKLISVRQLSDIDFFATTKQREQIIKLFEKLGYSPAEQFNFSNYPRALRFYARDKPRIDIWLDSFEMCHTLRFKDRLNLGRDTMPLEDLLFTKLQIVELNRKDVIDIFCLVNDHELGKDDPEHIDIDYLSNLCRDDWGLYKTITMNVQKIASLIDTGIPDLELHDEQRDLVKSRLGRILDRIESVPKTFRWKLRSKVGEKKTWHETPTARE